MVERDARGRFLPGNGESVGNNGGRPPIVRHIRELAREQSNTAFQSLLKIAASGESETARVTAIREILDRAWGKPKQTTEVTGAGGAPIRHTIEMSLESAKKFAKTFLLAEDEGE